VTGFAAGDVLWAPDPYNAGGDPRPWLVLATVKHDAVASAQGAVTEAFTRRVVDRSVAYLTGDVSGEY